MKQSQIRTDERSFRNFLENIPVNDLFSHAREHMIAELFSHIMMVNPYMHKNCVEILLHAEVKASAESLRTILQDQLEKLKDVEVYELMEAVFSKKQLIDILMEFTDDDTRQDIIENQHDWTSPAKQTIFYN